jgi:hypothetical protein
MRRVIPISPIGVRVRQPTKEEVCALLNYDPETGVFTYKVKRHKRNAGDVAGHINKQGRRIIGVFSGTYKSTRLAWLIMTGEWPDDLNMDHRDRNPANDAWSNLRLATDGENCRNTNIYKSNTSGIKGVSWRKELKKWQASIQVDGKQIHLGFFHEKESAAVRYASAAAAYHRDFSSPTGLSFSAP